MKKVTKYENKKILVLGLAKSGVSAAKLLHRLGAFVTVNDYKKFEENPEAQELLAEGITVITGYHPTELLDEGFSLVVKNPGIPYSNPMVARAEALEISIITEVELAYEIADCPIIGITGTNGKTTTTTMIGEVLNVGATNGVARLAGNIGLPASSVAQEAKSQDILVMELSSFQLLGTIDFQPKISVITNLYEAHLDYHGSRQEYVAAKWRIQMNMDASDFLVLNYNQKEVKELAKTTKGKVVPFSTNEEVAGAFLKDGDIYFEKECIMAASDLGVPGEHNLENALAAVAVAKILGTKNQDIKTALSNFKGVPHRTEYVGEFYQRKFYNDSKATNILATEKALSGFNHSKLILLAGGLDRGNSFDELVPALKEIKAVVLFGETKDKLKDAAEKAGIKNIFFATNVETAVEKAVEISQEGESILLSPACASWDQYPNFEVRGNRFIEAVYKWNNE